MYGDHAHAGHRWGMAIDLDRCTGCSACVVACQAENNVAVVGPEAVDYGREMAWLQLHLYWERDPNGHPVPLVTPMMCQQCDAAPCEPVCPAFAAYHTAEGLNGQIYNRCVGTRYCANNCPYKMRRFNWYEYPFPKPLELQLNPDVTVRSKGVMEKCTFCVQRIREGKERAKLEGRALRDGEVRPACAQTCPTGAIVFGDLLDPQSAVSRLATAGRGYRVLEHLGTRPSVTYLARVVRWRA
jgi:Fe-S-cluster-containing dehydrogenase component